MTTTEAPITDRPVSFNPMSPFYWHNHPAADRIRRRPAGARVLEGWAIADGYFAGASWRWIDEDEYDASALQLRAQDLAAALIAGDLTAAEASRSWRRAQQDWGRDELLRSAS